jgi:hypothetical protein
MQNKKLIAAIAAVIVIGAGAFFGGTVYEKDKLSSQGLLRSANAQGANGQRRPGGQQGQGVPGVAGGAGFARGNGGGSANGGGFVAGNVISKDDKGITVKAPDGGSKIIFFSDSTTIGKSISGSVSDLANGQQVMVSGQTNSDGTLTADNIQIRPATL